VKFHARFILSNCVPTPVSDSFHYPVLFPFLETDEPLASGIWSARGDLHSQGCSLLRRTGLLFPVNHAPLKLAHPAGLSPANSPFEAEHDCNFITDAKSEGGRRRQKNHRVRLPESSQLFFNLPASVQNGVCVTASMCGCHVTR